jgi:LysR family glycine cleavage system transcriptional activator
MPTFAPATASVFCGSPASVDQVRCLGCRPDRLTLPGFAAFRTWLRRQGVNFHGEKSLD